MAESRYALKRIGKLVPEQSGHRPKRRCTKCQQTLAGRKGHGFPGLNGHGLFCGGCANAFPPKGQAQADKILARYGGN